MMPADTSIPQHFFDICDAADEVAPAYGAILEMWGCDGNKEWTFVACGKDLEPPQEELNMIEVSPSCSTRQEQLQENRSQLIYSEFIPGRKVEVSEFEVELDFTANKYFKFRNMFNGRKLALWRIVGTDAEQTFFLWKGYIQSSNPSFPADEEATATIALKIRPTGPTFQGRLLPNMSVTSSVLPNEP